ncbi:uncharacterized protein LOC143363841, partial [Halictus rubicundus]
MNKTEPRTFFMGQDRYTTDRYVKIRIFDQSHKFFVIPDDFPLIEDGIIGLPCLEKYQYEISNDKIKLNDNVLYFQKPATVQPGEVKVQTIYLEGRPTRVCFFNFGETNKDISNQIYNINDIDQIGKFKAIVRTSHIEKNLREPIEKILIHYLDVFNLETDTLPCTNLAKHTITLKENKIINTKSYRPPECHKLEIEKQMNDMLNKKIIEESDSPYNSPVWVVPKKADASGKQKWRIVIDFRKLNELTDQDAYPLPDIDDILSQLGNAKFFSALDLSSGFHQIPMDPDSKKYTAFSTPQGHFHYNRMPFGLKNAPATFQRMMDTALRGLVNKHCFVYLDDIIIFGDTIGKHNENLAMVLQRLRELGLKIQPDKCEFLKPELEYLGHLVTAEGVKPNPKKILAVERFKVPTTPTEIKSFLGLSGHYRKFIRNFSKIAKPLTDLTQKDVPFHWTDKQQNSFETLKQKLCEAPVLTYPDFNRQFTLTTDASNEGIGAVLSQDGHPCCYISRTLNAPERNYTTTEKELLAIVWAVKRLRQYLLGRKFVIRTDHQAIKWLNNCKDPSSRLMRWRLKLEEYEYEIEYTKGKDNTAADALSRVHAITRQQDEEDPEIQNHLKIFDEWEKDETIPARLKIVPNDHTFYQLTKTELGNYDRINWLKKIYQILQKSTKIGIGDKALTEMEKNRIKIILMYFNDRYKTIYFAWEPIRELTEEEIETILKENHNDATGHFGIQKTYQRIKDKFKIPHLMEKIEDYVKRCDACQKEKLTRIRPKEMPIISDTPMQPNDKIAMDIVGPMTKTKKGNQFILSIHDDLTKYLILVPLKTQQTESILNALLDHYIYIFSAPKTILTDQGQNFVSELMTKFEEAFKIKHVKTTSFHPQSNGSLERTHATVKDLIRTSLHDSDKEWDDVLNFICLGYNTSIHEATGFTPFELTFGRKANLPSSIARTTGFTYDEMFSLWQKQLNRYLTLARETLLKSKKRYQRDQRRKIVRTQAIFKEGDFVLVHNDHKKDKLDVEWTVTITFTGNLVYGLDIVPLEDSSIFHEEINKAYLYNSEVDIYIGLNIDDVFIRFNQVKMYTKETVETQLLMQQAIGRSLQNLKKLGKSNWTKSVLRTRIVHLQDLWRKFEHGYARLLSIIPAEERAKNPYFKEDSFAHTEEVYLNSLSFMTTQLDALNSDTRHHSLLHEDAPPPAPPNSEPSTPPVPSSEVNSHLASTLAAPRSGILLATAWVQLRVPSGRCVTVRALIDQGSETSFVTETMVHLLRAKRTRVATSISAVGGVHAGTVRLHVAPRDSASPSIVTTALVLTSLSTYMPKRMHNIRSLEHLSDLNWADADPSSSAAIHLILGADIYPSIILDGLRKGSSGQPIAQKTIFGWVISGPITSHSRDLSVARGSSPQPRSGSSISMHHCIHQDTLSNELRRFWEIEEIPSTSPLTQEEEQCERHFQTHTSRAPDGQYIVRLPFRTGPPIEVGHSRSAAEKVLQSISRKLLLQPSLTEEYEEFLREYEALGHMRRVPISPSTSQCVYIPHHPVLRTDSVTTHLRVVFNASSVTSNGSTLNDHLLPGPKLQLDLSTVILRWRTFRFVYTADIAKMYRQILVDERDVDYQRILWRPISSKDTQAFQLLTVTYGMTCAPFLALRVLQQLIEDDGGQFPLAVPVLRSHIYVDDVLFGGNDLLAIRHSRDQLIQLLQRGHMKLRKWASNSVDFLADIDPEDHGLACSKNLAPDDRVKILGISWNPSRDSFQFKVSLAEPLPSTKRAILSTIAKLYDPLGWVTPAIISAKIFIQGLWRLRIGWDDQIPPQSLEQWKSIHSRLPVLNGLQISRWIGSISEASRIELHGFADASTVAYAAVVFARCISSSGTITVSLLAGKSKVAPLTPLTIPRLELQAAVLLARLMNFVSSALDLRDAPCYCWTDSTVALAWLQSHPSKWKTFVANRVADVQTRLPHAIWRHVPTADNPADCASRGLLSDELLRYHLWWKGPAWLPYDLSEWPTQPRHFTLEDSSESKVVHHSVVPAPAWDLDSRFSSWPKLIRVTAYIQRFVRNSRSCRSDNRKRHPGRALSASECTAAKLFWLRRIQESQFAKGISSLSNGEPLPPKDPIESLHPFLDETGLLRVGGRLRNSPLPHQSKHPILLSPHPLVRLIIEQAHARALHAGVQLTLHILRQEYWLLRGRSQVKAVIHACVRCVRERAAIPIQIMGDLPAARVSPAKKPFSHCGLDYAGPIQIRASAGRGITSRKAYIALFVCMSTKAVHLELVADYSTSAFLNAYTRFCSRRGLPERMYSDNGTTFVGANRELVSAYRAALRDPDFQNRTASDGVAWHFIPPSAPHFGGLWEAGVKSVKHHLRRVLGDRTLTFEEFTTLLCAIEACLNSRPIAPLSDTLDDYEPLTPGHFLIGSALTTPPQPSLLDLAENRLSRWQLVRHTTERLWKLWQNEYLNTLQQRGATKINITYETRIKTIPLGNDTDLHLILDTLESTPKIISNINSYQNTLDQITDRTNQLTYSHRIESIKHWGLTTLQIAGYVSLGLLGETGVLPLNPEEQDSTSPSSRGSKILEDQNQSKKG